MDICFLTCISLWQISQIKTCLFKVVGPGLVSINFNIYYDSCMTVKKAISIRKAELMEQKVINCESDQKKLFSLIHSLFGSKKITVLPEYTSSFILASSINMFFI